MRLPLAASVSIAALLLTACGNGETPVDPVDTEEEAAAGIELSPLEPEEDADAFRARVEGMSEEEQAEAIFQRTLRTARGCEPGDAPLHAFVPRDRADGEASADYNASIADQFISENVLQPCVFQTPTGLQFRIERAAGPDNPSPVSGEIVRVHYAGQLLDGTEFDSSYARGAPAEFPSDRLIAGWVEALPLMRTGEKWTLYIAPELGYGARGTPGGPIPPNAALVFQLELLGIPGRE